MGAMALGLFASLLIGTIFNALGMIPGLSILSTIGKGAQGVAGPAMAVAIAVSLKASPLVVYSCAAVGALANSYGGAGGPLAVLIIAIIASEVGMLVSKKTKVDILVTPFVTLLTGGLLSVLLAGYIGQLVGYVSDFIGWATMQQPLLMGILVSVTIGVALTLPISSAAICAAISVGFAVMSFKENRFGGLVSQGIGTSMLQMPNIIHNPRIWIPTILTSAITGPLATCVFKMQMYGAAINSGMGTCGLLGPIGIILGWFGGDYPATVGVMDWVGLALICLILPALLSLLFSELLYRIGWIKSGDLTLGD